MFEFTTLAVVTGIFLLAGLVKGIIGMGLPTVSLGLLVMFVELPTAMALMLIPSFITNIWQSLAGGNTRFLIKKIGVFLLAATLAVWIGTKLLSMIDLAWATIILGTLLIGYASSQLAGLTVGVLKQQNNWLAVGVGIVNGIFGGLTGAFIFPGLMYLQAHDFNKDQLVQAMGMLFILTTISLALGLGGHNLLDFQVGWLSVWVIVPAVLGMTLGRRIRRRFSETQFRKVFFSSILLLGVMIIITGLSK